MCVCRVPSKIKPWSWTSDHHLSTAQSLRANLSIQMQILHVLTQFSSFDSSLQRYSEYWWLQEKILILDGETNFMNWCN